MSNNMFFDLFSNVPPLEQLDMLITLGEGDMALKCMPSVITLRGVLPEFYEYRMHGNFTLICTVIVIHNHMHACIADCPWN